MSERIRMTFECDQDWEAMKPTPCGRYCDVCKKEVYDFTQKTIEEINYLKGINKELCGMFLPGQVEQDLVPIEAPAFRKLKLCLTAAAAFVGLETAQAKANEKKQEKIEIVAGAEQQVFELLKDNPTVPWDTEKAGQHPTGRDSRKQATWTMKRLRYFLSKKFPFSIKKRKHRRVGKF